MVCLDTLVGPFNPKLERKCVVLLLLLLLCMSCSGDPPGFRRGMDWRALVKN